MAKNETGFGASEDRHQEELQPDPGFQAALALVCEKEIVCRRHREQQQASFDRCWKSSGLVTLIPAAVPSPLEPDEHGTSLQLQPGCHHGQEHAKSPLPTGGQECRLRPVKPAERGLPHLILVSLRRGIRRAALFWPCVT